MKNTVNQVVKKFTNLKTAYQFNQNFKQWYNYQNRIKSMDKITKELYKWYARAAQLKEFKAVIKMIRKHEDPILNFFQHGITNAKAEPIERKNSTFLLKQLRHQRQRFFPLPPISILI